MQSNELEALLGGETTYNNPPIKTDTVIPPPEIKPNAEVNPYVLPTSLNAQDLQDSVKARAERDKAEAEKLLQSIDLDPVTKATEDHWLVKAFSDMPEEGRQFRRGLMQNVRATKQDWAKKQQTGGVQTIPTAQPDKINYQNIDKFRGFYSDVDKDTRRKNLTYGLSTGDLILERINDDDFVFHNRGDGKRGNLPVARITNDGDISGIKYVPDESLMDLAGMFNQDYRSHFKDNQDFNNYLHKLDRGEVKLDLSTRMLESPTGMTKNVRRAMNIANPAMATHSPADFYFPPEIVENGQTNFNAWDIVPEVTGAIIATGAVAATLPASLPTVATTAILAGAGTTPTFLKETEDYTSGNQSAQETGVNIATDYVAGMAGIKYGGQFVEGIKQGGKILAPLTKSALVSGGAAGTQDIVHQAAVNPEIALTNDGADPEFKWNPMQTGIATGAGAVLDGTFNSLEGIGSKLVKQLKTIKPKLKVNADGTTSTNAEEIVKSVIDNSEKSYKFNPQTGTYEETTFDPVEIANTIQELNTAIKSGANDVELDPLTGRPIYVNNPENTIDLDGVASNPTGSPVQQYNNKFILDERGKPVDPYTVDGAGYVLRDEITNSLLATSKDFKKKDDYFYGLVGDDKTPLGAAYKNGTLKPDAIPNYVTDILKHKEATNDVPIAVNDPKTAITIAINEANNTLNGKFVPTEKEKEMLGDMATQFKISRGDEITPAEEVFAAKELIVYTDKVKTALIDKVKTNPEYGASAESIVNKAYRSVYKGTNNSEANKSFLKANKDADPIMLDEVGKKIEKKLIEIYPGLKDTIDKPKPKTYPKPIENYTQDNYNDVNISKVSYEDDYNNALVNNVVMSLYGLKDKDVALDELKYAGIGPKHANQLVKNIENAVAKTTPDDNGVIHLNKDSFSFDRPAGAESDWIAKEVIKPIISNYKNDKLVELKTPLPVSGNNADLSRAMLVIAPTPEQLSKANNIELADAKAWQKMLIDDIGKQTGYSPNQVKAFAKKTVEDAVKTGIVNVDKHLKTPTQLIASVNDAKTVFDIETKKTSNKASDAEKGTPKEDTTAKNYYVADTQFVPNIADKKYGSLYNTIFDAVHNAESPAEAKANIEVLENEYGLKPGTLWKFGSSTYDKIANARTKIGEGKFVVPKDKPNNLIEISTSMSPTQAHDLNAKILGNKVLQEYGAYIPTITTRDNYPVTIPTDNINTLKTFPFTELEFRALLNHNQNTASAEDTMILRRYFADNHNLKPEQLNAIKNEVLQTVNTTSNNLSQLNERLDTFPINEDLAKKISEFTKNSQTANKKNMAPKTAQSVKAESNLDDENTSVSSTNIIAQDIKKSTLPIFMATYEDDEEEKDDFWTMSINGIGMFAIAGIIGGKHLRKYIPESVLRVNQEVPIGDVEVKVNNSLGLAKELADFQNDLVKLNPNLAPKEFVDKSNDYKAKVTKEALDLHNELDKYTYGTVSQKAGQMGDQWLKQIHNKAALAREEANQLASPITQMLTLWKKEAPSKVKKALIKGHQTFRKEYLDLLHTPEFTAENKSEKLTLLRNQFTAVTNNTSLTPENKATQLAAIRAEYLTTENRPTFTVEQKKDAMQKMASEIFNTHIYPAYANEVNGKTGNVTAVTRDQLWDRFLEFRQLQNGLSVIDVERYINNDLRSFPYKEYLTSAPNGRVSYEDLKRMEPEVKEKLKPLQERIDKEKEELKDYLANRRRPKDKRIDHAANNAAITSTRIEIKQLEADKEYATLSQVAKIIESADEFLTNSKASMYFDVHAARRMDERQNNEGLTLKSESGENKFFKMLPNKTIASEKKDAILKEWGAVKDADQNYYILRPIYDADGKLIVTQKDKVLITRFNKDDNANTRVNQKKALINQLENLLSTSSIVAKGAMPADVAAMKDATKSQLTVTRSELLEQLRNGDEEAAGMLNVVNQSLTLLDKIGTDGYTTGAEMANHWIELQKTINGGGNSLQNIKESRNYDGYRNSYDDTEYTPDDYVAGFAETVAKSVTAAERNAMLSEIETQYGLLHLMGLTDNKYAKWLKKERDAVTDNQIQFGLPATVVNNITAAKVTMDIGARANIAVGNYFSNVYNNSIYEYTYGNAAENGLRLKNQLKNHLEALGHTARNNYYNVKSLWGVKDPYKTKWEKSAAYVKYLNDLHQGKLNAETMLKSNEHYDNMLNFKTSTIDRFAAGGGLTESSISDLNLNTGRNPLGKIAQSLNKGAHVLNRGADKIARRSVIGQVFDKAIEDLGGLEGIPFNDPVAIKKLQDKIILDAHLASDQMFGRYNELYKTDLEKAILRDKTLGQFAPSLLRFTSPFLVSLNNSFRLAEKMYARTVSANKDNNGVKDIAGAHLRNIAQVGAFATIALMLGGTRYSSALNDILAGMDYAGIGDIDDEGMLSPYVNTGYLERAQNWFKTTLMDAGFNPAAADKAVVAIKRGLLTGLTDIQLSQQESMLGSVNLYVGSMFSEVMDLAAKENITGQDVANAGLNGFTGGMVKDFFKYAPDVLKGSRTERDFNMLNREYESLERKDNETLAEKQYRERAEELYEEYNYTPLDLLGQLAFNKPALRGEAARDKGRKGNKMSTLGPDNSIKVMNTFFNNAGISITVLDDSNLKRGLKQEMTDPIIAEKYAPYIMEAYMNRLDNDELKKGLEFTSELASDVLMKNQEYIAEIANLNAFGMVGTNRAEELEKIVRNVKSVATDMLTTEVATQALNDFLETPQGQEFGNKYKINKPTNSTYNKNGIKVARLLQLPIELKPRGEYANDKEYAIHNAKIAAITSLVNYWKGTENDPSYQALRKLALYIYDPDNNQLENKSNATKP